MSSLAVAAFTAASSDTPRSPEALIALQWADALLRSRRRVSPRRIEACTKMLKREFGI